jgi:hypothetical protein
MILYKSINKKEPALLMRETNKTRKNEEIEE